MNEKTYTIDAESIDQLYADILEFQQSLITKNDEFAMRLAEYGSSIAGGLFGSGATMSVTKIDDAHYAITAQGDAVCFLEFGTGTWVDEDHPYVPKVPIEVYPGSWSDSPLGAGTYQDWVAKGKNGPYPYNTMPRRPMLSAYNDMVLKAKEIAREVFG